MLAKLALSERLPQWTVSQDGTSCRLPVNGSFISVHSHLWRGMRIVDLLLVL